MATPMTRADRFNSQFGVSGTVQSKRGRNPERNEVDVEDSPDPTSLDYRFGELAPLGMRFCPIQAVAKFPYKYMSKNYMETVADKFFSKGLFWKREWDLYWVWSPYYDTSKAYVFIPLDQFKQLVKEIDSTIPSQRIKIPSNPEDIGLVVNFDNHPDLRPRWLGTSRSKYDYDFLESSAYEFAMSSGNPPEDKVAYFKEKMEAAVDATKQKSKAAREKRKEERAVKQQDMGRAFKRAQRYLGLRPRTTLDDGLTRTASPELRPLDVTKPVPFAFDMDVIIIAVDVEAWERNHNIITEIGIATLDTRSLQSIAPGACGVDWRSQIHARHFRVKEYTHLTNGDFVAGCPDRFDFGQSEMVTRYDTPSKVASCFKPPYSEVDASGMSAYGIAAERRNIVFLGHDTQQDVQYLQKAGYDVTNLSNLVEFQDTSTMYRAFSQESNPRNLGHVLYLCEVDAWNLHNAGNDAVFTLQAMLGLCVKDAAENRGDLRQWRSREREAELEKRIEIAKQEAEERVRDAAEGWELDDGDDGGVPLLKQMGRLRVA